MTNLPALYFLPFFHSFLSLFFPSLFFNILIIFIPFRLSVDDIAERKKRLELKISEHENSPKKLIHDSRSFRINEKSIKIARYKQRKILSEVFDILLATVVYAKHTAKENKLNNKSQMILNFGDNSNSTFPSNITNNGNGKKFFCQQEVNNSGENFTENYQFPSDLYFILTEMEKNDSLLGNKKMQLIDYKLLREKESKSLLNSSFNSHSTIHSINGSKRRINNNNINNEDLKLLNFDEIFKKSKNYSDKIEHIEIPENGDYERGELSARSYGENDYFYRSNQNEQKSPLSSRNGDITISEKPFSSTSVYHRSTDYQSNSKSVFSSNLPQGNKGQNRENNEILSSGAYLLSFDRDGRNSLEFSKILELNGKREEGRKVKRILLNQNNYFSEDEEENSNSEISDFCENKSENGNENENENENKILHYHSKNKFQINNNDTNFFKNNQQSENENENENEIDLSSESSSRSASSYLLAPSSSQGCLDVFLAQPGGCSYFFFISFYFGSIRCMNLSLDLILSNSF
jgi:hypothetical protein